MVSRDSDVGGENQRDHMMMTQRPSPRVRTTCVLYNILNYSIIIWYQARFASLTLCVMLKEPIENIFELCASILFSEFQPLGVNSISRSNVFARHFQH